MSVACETCRWWLQGMRIYTQDNHAVWDTEVILYPVGDCRIRAPLTLDQSRFPTTLGDDWCGEHQAKEPQS